MTETQSSASHEFTLQRFRPLYFGSSLLAALIVLLAGVGAGTEPNVIGGGIFASGCVLVVISQAKPVFRSFGAGAVLAGVFVVLQASLDGAGTERAALALGMFGTALIVSETAPVQRLGRWFDELVDPYVETAGARLGRWIAERSPRSNRRE